MSSIYLSNAIFMMIILTIIFLRIRYYITWSQSKKYTMIFIGMVELYVLMDAQMPRMNGYEATQKIRQLADVKKAQIPIIAMTANAFEEDRKHALDAGMDGFIMKPFRVDEMMKVIGEVME